MIERTNGTSAFASNGSQILSHSSDSLSFSAPTLLASVLESFGLGSGFESEAESDSGLGSSVSFARFSCSKASFLSFRKLRA